MADANRHELSRCCKTPSGYCLTHGQHIDCCYDEFAPIRRRYIMPGVWVVDRDDSQKPESK